MWPEVAVYYFFVLLLVAANIVAWSATLFALPGNWIVLGITALFAWLADGPEGQGIGWAMVLVLLALAILGELVEFGAAAAGAARLGASRRGVVLSIAGAVAGSIVGVMVGLPIPVVGSAVAAVLGGAAGAFTGAFLGEQWKGRPYDQRLEIGKGAFLGRLWGTVAKLVIGAIMIVLATFDALV